MTMEFVPLNEWGLQCNPFFIGAGPCSAESEEQLMATALALKARPLRFIRAGIWKPRKRPGSFEGVGREGLWWLVRARGETPHTVGTEVATPAPAAARL